MARTKGATARGHWPPKFYELYMKKKLAMDDKYYMKKEKEEK